MPTHLAILGDGAWGTAVALLLAQHPQHRVSLWSAREENGKLLRERRENVKLLPGVHIPESILLTTDLAQAIDQAQLWIMAIPTVYLRSVLTRIAPQLPPGRAVLSLAKGLENQTFLRPTQILSEFLATEQVATLSGPSHAEEVVQGMPTSLVVASSDLHFATHLQALFTTERFRVYTNLDVIGVELGGALKNVIALAAGISDGLGFGDNAKSALLTRGLVEMAKFGVAHGAEHATFMGLAGVGDLLTTCFSKHGRNRRVGEALGQGRKLADILQSTSMVAEGVYTAKSVYQRAEPMGLDMPITREVYRVLYEDKDPRQAVHALMLRQPKPEK